VAEGDSVSDGDSAAVGDAEGIGTDTQGVGRLVAAGVGPDVVSGPPGLVDGDAVGDAALIAEPPAKRATDVDHVGVAPRAAQTSANAAIAADRRRFMAGKATPLRDPS
jgi:hypothetical protein